MEIYIQNKYVYKYKYKYKIVYDPVTATKKKSICWGGQFGIGPPCFVLAQNVLASIVLLIDKFRIGFNGEPDLLAFS